MASYGVWTDARWLFPALEAATRLARIEEALARLELTCAAPPPAASTRRDADSESLPLSSELSDGTRIQLLLACRLAYLEEAEGDTKTPLFLDEVLSTTDPERFTAVAGAVIMRRLHDNPLLQ